MILSYSLISSVIFAFCYFAYRYLLAGTRQHAVNRRLLLAIYAASLTIPLIVLAVVLHSNNSVSGVGNIEIGEITSEITTNGDHTGNFISPTITNLVFKIYVGGLVITSIYFLFGLCMLWRIKKDGERSEFGNFILILVDDNNKISPFSWHDSIVMNRADYEEDGDIILVHEYAHLKLFHWTDLVLAYLTICIQWYNPAAWAMREELKAVHEYQADEKVIESGVNIREYQLLLLKRAVGSGYQSFANSLNHSKLQKRVTMMYKEKTSLQRRLFALALIPAIGAGIAVTTIPSVAGVLESLATTPVATTTSTFEEASAPAKDRTVFVAVQDNAEFPGGMDALLNYLRTNIRYPESAHKNNIQGRVIVKFVIESDGTVADAEIVRGVDTDLDNEALRVVNGMPKWTPAKVDGKDVASYFHLPVNFKLQDETPKEENQQTNVQ